MRQLAQCPSQPQSRPIPYGLLSLWDMINFSVRDLIETIVAVGTMHRGTADAQGADRQLTAQQRADVHKLIEHVQHVASAHGHERTRSRIQRLAVDLSTSDHMTARRLHIDTQTLYHAIVDDLGEQFFYHYPTDKAVLVRDVPSPTFSSSVAALA
jgi:hypothetical protein